MGVPGQREVAPSRASLEFLESFPQKPCGGADLPIVFRRPGFLGLQHADRFVS